MQPAIIVREDEQFATRRLQRKILRPGEPDSRFLKHPHRNGRGCRP